MNNQEQNIRANIIEIGRRLYQQGLIVATEGNISARVDKDFLLITAAQSCKGFLNDKDVIACDYTGRAAEGKESSEIYMHLAVYRLRPDANAVIHAHPPHVVACSLAGLRFGDDLLPEIRLGIGKIGWAGFAPPSRREGADAVSQVIGDCEAVVLDRHGALTLGKTLEEAFYRMERLEFAARVFLLAKF
ncbi:MAG: class II aldolase/adducin family protein [Calditrichota bacterium]